MTKKLTILHLAILTALMLMGISSAYASEVTGTLSSGSATASQTTGSVGGSVGSENTLSGSVSGSNSSSGNSSGSNNSAGEVLGASIANAASPSFPNAGFGPSEPNVLQNIFVTGLVLTTILFLFMARKEESAI